MNTTEELLDLLRLETIDDNLYRGKARKNVRKRVFGGQVLAQALYAAGQTVPSERLPHSLHAYFILIGDNSIPVIYDVDRIRDGGSFTTRRVVAIQRGKPIFNMSASFQLHQPGIEHQINMPSVPAPDSLLSDVEIYERSKDQLPERLLAFLNRPRPIEFRPVESPTPLINNPGQPFQHVWIKAKGTFPKDQLIHRIVLAYASDYNLLMTALRPHKIPFYELIMASLDHAIWFHHDIKMDEWLLYALDSPSASNSRGFTRGNIFNQEGKLVASVVQEGLLRVKTIEK